jgi:hypothetical protein
MTFLLWKEKQHHYVEGYCFWTGMTLILPWMEMTLNLLWMGLPCLPLWPRLHHGSSFEIKPIRD